MYLTEQDVLDRENHQKKDIEEQKKDNLQKAQNTQYRKMRNDLHAKTHFKAAT